MLPEETQVIVKRATDLRLGDRVRVVKGTTPGLVFSTPCEDTSGRVTVVGVERIFGPKIRVTVMDGTNPDYPHSPPRYDQDFSCLELFELEPRLTEL